MRQPFHEARSMEPLKGLMRIGNPKEKGKSLLVITEQKALLPRTRASEFVLLDWNFLLLFRRLFRHYEL
jgi:hypothetical protein